MIQRIRNQPFAFGNSTQPLSLGMGCPCDEEPVPSMIAAGDEVWAQAAMTPCEGEGVIITGGPDDWGSPWVAETGWFITGEGFYRYNGSFTGDSALQYDSNVIIGGDAYIMQITVSGVTGTVIAVMAETEFQITADGTYEFTLIAATTTGDAYIVAPAGAQVTVESITVSTLNVNVSAIFHQGGTSTEITQAGNPEYFEFTNGRVTVHMPLSVGEITDGCFTLELVDNCTETSITSQEFSVVEDGCNTIVIRACNDYDGVGFSGTFVPRIRIPARMGWPNYNTEANEERHSDGAIFRPWADRTGSMTIKTGMLNEWDHAFLSTLPLWDHVYVGTGSQAREVVVATGRYQPERGESQWLNGAITFDVSPKDELIRKVACGPALAGCAPEADPICFDPSVVFSFVDNGTGTVLQATLLNNLNFAPGEASVTVGGGSPVVQTFGTPPSTITFGPFAEGTFITFRLVSAVIPDCAFTRSFTVPAVAAFVCSGYGYGSFTLDGGTDFVIGKSTTGYITTRRASDGSVIVHGTGAVVDFFITVPTDGEYCMWSSDDAGVLSGYLLQLQGDSQYTVDLNIQGYWELPVINLSNASALETLTLGSSTGLENLSMIFFAGTYIDLVVCEALQTLSFINSAALETVVMPGTSSLTTINFIGCALGAADVNAILAHAVAIGMTGGTINLSGGTSAAPSGAGITDKATLITAGNSVTTN